MGSAQPISQRSASWVLLGILTVQSVFLCTLPPTEEDPAAVFTGPLRPAGVLCLLGLFRSLRPIASRIAISLRLIEAPPRSSGEKSKEQPLVLPFSLMGIRLSLTPIGQKLHLEDASTGPYSIVLHQLASAAVFALGFILAHFMDGVIAMVVVMSLDAAWTVSKNRRRSRDRSGSDAGSGEDSDDDGGMHDLGEDASHGTGTESPSR